MTLLVTKSKPQFLSEGFHSPKLRKVRSTRLVVCRVELSYKSCQVKPLQTAKQWTEPRSCRKAHHKHDALPSLGMSLAAMTQLLIKQDAITGTPDILAIGIGVQ